MIAWLIARPLYAAALALTLALVGWHFQDKISDWWDGRKIARLESQVAALQGEVAGLKESARQQEAATKAAQAARDRNDAVLPPARAESAGRVSRAATADDAQRVLDVAAALEADRAAIGALRGKSASGADAGG